MTKILALPLSCAAWISLVGGACASAPSAAPIQYISAQRIDPPVSLPSVRPTVAVAEQTLIPGMFTPIEGVKRVPAADAKPPAPANPYEVVSTANRRATSAPTQHGFFNSIQQYVYVPGMKFKVFCALDHTTDIALQPGEKHVDPAVLGDSFRWKIGGTKSAVNGVVQEHITVKPLQPGLETNLTIHTNRRTYFLELQSFESETYMVAVEWLYAQDDVVKEVDKANEELRRDRSVISTLNPAHLNFHYAAEILQGEPDWIPKQVFDDGRKTYVRFPLHVQSREVPALFVERDGELQLTNYYARGEFYVVDRVFNQAQLIVGQKRQEIVRIARSQ